MAIQKATSSIVLMMLYDDDNRSYGPKDLEVFNLLQHPIWVFDSERKAMFWANHAALKIWKADSLQSLLSRDFYRRSGRPGAVHRDDNRF